MKWTTVEKEGKMGTAPNLEKLCRICTAEQTDNILIFSEEGKKLYLEAKMKKYLHIAVSYCANIFCVTLSVSPFAGNDVCI